jgi:uncharacterized integral membrane protein
MSANKGVFCSVLAALALEGALVGLGILFYYIEFMPMVVLLDWIHRPADLLLSSLGYENVWWPRVVVMVLFWALLFLVVASWK